MSKATSGKKAKAANSPTLETIFEGITLDDGGAVDVASLLSSKYVQLGVKESEVLQKEAYVKGKTIQCIEGNKKFKDSLIGVREAHAKAADKLNRLTSLCDDLAKRCNISSRPILEEAAAKRKVITDNFDGDIKKVTTRVDELSQRKLDNVKSNELLKRELTAVIDETQKLDKEEEKITKGDGIGIVEDEVPQLIELDIMSYEDYLTSAKSIMDRQDHLRVQLSTYNNLFQELQTHLKSTTTDFEVNRKQIDQLSSTYKEKHLERFEVQSNIKTAAKEIKRHSTYAEELKKRLEEEKEKREKLQKIVAAFEEDVKIKEADLVKLKASL